MGKMLDATSNRGEPFPYLANRDVQWGRCDVSRLGQMRFTAEDRARFSLRPGDLLVCEGGEVGRTAIWHGEVADCYYQKAIHRLRPKRDLDPRFALYYMMWAARRGTLRRLTSATSIAHLTKEKLESAPFPDVPAAAQIRIADILDKADALRRKRREALGMFEDLLQGVFAEHVGERNADYQSWPQRRIEQLAAPVDGSMRTGPFGSALLHSEFVEEGVAVLGIDNAVQNRFAWGERRYITPEKYETLKRYTVFPGDVIVTIMGTVGRSAVIPDGIPAAITTKHLATITPNRDLVLPEYLANAIHRDQTLLRQLALRTRGAIMDGLNLGLIRELEVRLPPLSAQTAFLSALQKVRALYDRQQEALDALDTLFNTLFHGAFNGEL